MVEALLELAPEPMQLCTAVNAEGMTPLHCAARDGREATARALLRRAPDGYALLQISQKSSSALRPLHLAAKSGHLERYMSELISMASRAMFMRFQGLFNGFFSHFRFIFHGFRLFRRLSLTRRW